MTSGLSIWKTWRSRNLYFMMIYLRKILFRRDLKEKSKKRRSQNITC